MQVKKTMQKTGYFWLALLLHVLLLLSFSWPFVLHPIVEQRPALYIPSYVYQGVPNSVPESVPQPVSTQAQQSIPTSKKGIEKPAQTASSVQPVQTSHSTSLAQPAPSARQMQEVTSTKNADPVHLIGEKKVDAPLLKLLGQAITAHLVYPKIAQDFNLKGVSLIRFVIHPNGEITHIQLIKSSHAGVLDEAALAAFNAMSPVANVGPYVTKPMTLVFGIIFE